MNRQRLKQRGRVLQLQDAVVVYIYQWQRRIERRLELMAKLSVFRVGLVYKYMPREPVT